ncbi:MAG: ATP-binding protein [Veillonella sp.]|uniref:ATP-binding protein n=1 Tax=Veillonella sp. TaxID=1926307 RepID=UPI0025D844BB|nr:ATP-binding protein [Veillonella sp.]MBE6079325.1 ATP-binding protein [Veillonella sp.]
MMSVRALKPRDFYLNKLIAFKDTEPVKVVTGIRRCGKSSLLKLMIAWLKEQGISDDAIVEMNFESFTYKDMSADDVYAYVKERISKTGITYLFFDEIQRVSGWEEAINAFRVDFNCDIYVTGSNTYLLSSEYTTYLSGRSVEIKMLPLSFKEFIEFNSLTLKEIITPLGTQERRVYDDNGQVYLLSDIFNLYLRFGGMPGIADVGFDQDRAMTLLDGIYNTVVVRDILEREQRRNQRQVTDSDLLQKIVRFLADNVGSNISASSIGNTLVNEGLLDTGKRSGGRNGTPSAHTVQAYIATLLEAYFFYEIKRFDIKGREFLRTLGKYYIVDIGLRNYLLGFRDRDTGHVLENVVYLELLRRGYDVAIGKIDRFEVDFIATKADEKLYIQVTESMRDETVRERELRPLQKIQDNYKKLVLTLEPGIEREFGGIQVVNVVDWLVGK